MATTSTAVWKQLMNSSSTEMTAVFVGVSGCVGVLGSLGLLFSHCIFRRYCYKDPKILCISLCDLGLGLQYGLILCYFSPRLRPLLQYTPVLGHAFYAPSCVWIADLATQVCTVLHRKEGGPLGRLPAEIVVVVAWAFPISLFAAATVQAAVAGPSFALTEVINRCCFSWTHATSADIRPVEELVPWLLHQRAFGTTGALAYFTVAVICAGLTGFMYNESLRCIKRNEGSWGKYPDIRVVRIRALAVLMVFVLTRGPVIIYLALRVIRATSVPPWLMFMAAIGEASQGLWNGLLFGCFIGKYFGKVIARQVVI